jgi:leucyl/phenylalanyl-tRNA--protein transferase
VASLRPAPQDQPIGPLSMLWEYANGGYPLPPTTPGTKTTWERPSHRGIQLLDRIRIPRKQRNYVFNKRFQIRYNSAFGEVIRHCANPTRDPDGTTWITPALIDGYQALHRLGFAHSFEAWEDGRLVGGGFGVQIGGFVSADSMFHLTDHASKAAYVQMLLGLRDSGFAFVDVNDAAGLHTSRWGAEWVPRWQFEQMLRAAVARPLPFLDGRIPPALPWAFRVALPARALAAKVARTVKSPLRRLRARSIAVNVPVPELPPADPQPGVALGSAAAVAIVPIDAAAEPDAVNSTPCATQDTAS